MAVEKRPTYTAIQIKRRRQELGMTQNDLARLLDYSDRSSVSWIEQGRKRLKPAELQRIAEALQTTPDKLSDPEGTDDFARYILSLWKLVPEADRALAARCVSGVLLAFSQQRIRYDFIMTDGDQENEK